MTVETKKPLLILPGYKLDEMIITEVFGRKCEVRRIGTSTSFGRKDRPIKAAFEFDDHGNHRIPSYSDTLKGAQEILEFMADKYGEYGVRKIIDKTFIERMSTGVHDEIRNEWRSAPNPKRWKYICHIGSAGDFVFGKTFEHAVCLSALTKVREENE